MTELIHLSAARQAIAKAKSVDEVAKIRDTARAVETYAKARNLSIEVFNDAAEIKVRAEIRAGELLAEMNLKPGNPQLSKDSTIAPTLDQMGINRDESSRWQAMA